MANTKDTIGERATLDGLVAGTLTDFEDDEVVYPHRNTFSNKSMPQHISLPNCTKVDQSTFLSNSGLVSISLPNLVAASNNLFQGCDNLATVNIDKVGTLNNYLFSGCKRLESITLPKAYSLGNYCFNQCISLETLDMGGDSVASPSVNGSSTFAGCNRIRHWILRNRPTTLGSGISYFPSSPVGEFAIYVPSDLLDSYKSTYSSMASKFHTLEEYPITDFSTITDSWDDIIAATQDGTYADKYAIGARKSLDIDGTRYYMQLVAKNADVLASDGTTTVPTTWLLYRYMHHAMEWNYTQYAWTDSSVRTWLTDTVLPALPSNVRAAIKEVRKYTNELDTVSETTVPNRQTSERLWVPSAREMAGGSTYESTGVGAYEYFTSNALRSKYGIKSNTDGTSELSAMAYFTRTSDGSNLRGITPSGSLGSYQNKGNVFVCFGFCI